LLVKIAGLAKAIDALLEAGMPEQARPLSRELIALATTAQSS
jgi:replication-associated recombination protein RarA